MCAGDLSSFYTRRLGLGLLAVAVAVLVASPAAAQGARIECLDNQPKGRTL
jgi:hypothetical protein